MSTASWRLIGMMILQTRPIGSLKNQSTPIRAFSLWTLCPANTATYFDSNVTMYGEEYHYRVFAENTVSISDYSNEVVYEGLGIKSALDQNLLIYPNPTNGELIIKANAMTLNKMTLFNLQGQILKEKNSTFSRKFLRHEQFEIGYLPCSN